MPPVAQLSRENPNPELPSQDCEPVSVQTPDSALRQPGKLVRDIASDLWAGRELAWRMFLRNIRGLYRQSYLGLFWAFLPPLANTAVWVILREANAVDLAKILPEGVDRDRFSYAVYVMTGMVVWQSFVEAVQGPLQAVQSNRNLLSKLKFPRESILLVQFFEVLFNLAIRTLVLIPLLLVMPSAGFCMEMLLVPVLVLLLLFLGFAIGLLLMPFGMLYQDVGKTIAIALPVWMILTPIIYLPPKDWAGSPLNFLNPASPLLSASRDLLVFGNSLVPMQMAAYWIPVVVYGLLAIPFLLFGLLLYRLAIPVLVERISV